MSRAILARSRCVSCGCCCCCCWPLFEFEFDRCSSLNSDPRCASGVTMHRLGGLVHAPRKATTFGCDSRRISATSARNSRMPCGVSCWSIRRFMATSVRRHAPR